MHSFTFEIDSQPPGPPMPETIGATVRRLGVTEKEAAEMMKWAFEQVRIAAAIYTAVTLPAPKR